MRLSMASMAKVPALAAAACLALPAAALDVSYQFSLSDFTGVLPLPEARLKLDAEHNEVLVIVAGQVRIFNQSGMQVYSFGDDADLGHPLDAVALEGGDLMVLAYTAGLEVQLVRCNFRGEPAAKVPLTGLPADLAKEFRPGAIARAGSRLFLADMAGMRIVVADLQGAYQRSFDVAEILDVAKKRADLGLRGFSVDRDGNVLFTIQPLFHGYVLSPEGTIREFGERGSAPGKFNIVAGIARDDAGKTYVTDILKSAVLVFDRDLKFQKEFGYRGPRPGNLAAPIDVVAQGGKVWVSQNARRGVNVYRVSEEAPN
jgi:DNA-binding beta-propeller fold protein YncE